MLNHAAAFLVTYFLDEAGQPHFLCEKKSADFPRFPNRIGFLGGNCLFKKHTDISAHQTLTREIKEEFLLQNESELSEMISFPDGSVYLPASSTKPVSFTASEAQKTKKIGSMLLDKISYGGSYIDTMIPPLSGTQPMVWGTFAFTRRLNLDEFKKIKSLIGELNYMPTIDNRKFGSTVNFYTGDDIKLGTRWHGEHDLTLNALSEAKIVPFSFQLNYDDAKRDLISIQRFSSHSAAVLDAFGVPLYKSLEEKEIVRFSRK